MKYGFFRSHRHEFRVRTMCRVLDVHPSGFYAWLKEPLSQRSKEDHRQTGLVKQSWLESGCVYDYRKVYDDLRDLGERCGKHRVHRLMRLAGIQAQRNQKQVPIGIHRIQDIAAVVVWATICGVVVVPENPVT